VGITDADERRGLLDSSDPSASIDRTRQSQLTARYCGLPIEQVPLGTYTGKHWVASAGNGSASGATT